MIRDVVLVYGKTGMGKSLWTKRHVSRLPRYLVMDPQAEYRDALYNADVAELIDRLRKMPRAFKLATPDVEGFPLLCEAAMAVGNCWLVVDETQRVVPAGPPPPSELLDVIYRGRHPRVSLLMVSQRPTTVHISARSQWDRIITFNQTEKQDVKWIQSVSGFDVDPRELAPLEYFDISAHGFERRKLDPPRGYVARSKAALQTATTTEEE